jgi:hypothetical protein
MGLMRAAPLSRQLIQVRFTVNEMSSETLTKAGARADAANHLTGFKAGRRENHPLAKGRSLLSQLLSVALTI